ncbi:ribonuclease domain-containing protein [Actinomadura hibisca]|uniref:ribonuclease domain-containing protein n=1 Tax=Actinomadura hibisca TaxID=68565 RepID=UPI0008334AB1|nr:ribonuclease domain-containing protein [Actinomadura hibisca]
MTATTRTLRTLAACVLGPLLLLPALAGCTGGDRTAASPTVTVTVTAPAPTASGPGATASQGSIGEIPESRLPAEARETLRLIEAGGPFPYRQDGTYFRNREGLLPQRKLGYYREYTVPTPGAKTRGARRIIGGESGERYYTADHYRSYARVTEG